MDLAIMQNQNNSQICLCESKCDDHSSCVGKILSKTSMTEEIEIPGVLGMSKQIEINQKLSPCSIQNCTIDFSFSTLTTANDLSFQSNSSSEQTSPRNIHSEKLEAIDSYDDHLEENSKLEARQISDKIFNITDQHNRLTTALCSSNIDQKDIPQLSTTEDASNVESTFQSAINGEFLDQDSINSSSSNKNLINMLQPAGVDSTCLYEYFDYNKFKFFKDSTDTTFSNSCDYSNSTVRSLHETRKDILNVLNAIRSKCFPWGLPPLGESYSFHWRAVFDANTFEMLEPYVLIFSEYLDTLSFSKKLLSLDYSNCVDILAKLEHLRRKQLGLLDKLMESPHDTESFDLNPFQIQQSFCINILEAVIKRCEAWSNQTELNNLSINFEKVDSAKCSIFRYHWDFIISSKTLQQLFPYTNLIFSKLIAEYSGKPSYAFNKYIPIPDAPPTQIVEACADSTINFIVELLTRYYRASLTIKQPNIDSNFSFKSTQEGALDNVTMPVEVSPSFYERHLDQLKSPAVLNDFDPHPDVQLDKYLSFQNTKFSYSNKIEKINSLSEAPNSIFSSGRLNSENEPINKIDSIKNDKSSDITPQDFFFKDTTNFDNYNSKLSATTKNWALSLSKSDLFCLPTSNRYEEDMKSNNICINKDNSTKVDTPLGGFTDNRKFEIDFTNGLCKLQNTCLYNSGSNQLDKYFDSLNGNHKIEKCNSKGSPSIKAEVNMTQNRVETNCKSNNLTKKQRMHQKLSNNGANEGFSYSSKAIEQSMLNQTNGNDLRVLKGGAGGHGLRKQMVVNGTGCGMRGALPQAGYPNVSFDVTHNRWIAFWRLNGRNHSKSFSCNKYGSREVARQKAVEFRKQLDWRLYKVVKEPKKDSKLCDVNFINKDDIREHDKRKKETTKSEPLGRGNRVSYESIALASGREYGSLNCKISSEIEAEVNMIVLQQEEYLMNKHLANTEGGFAHFNLCHSGKASRLRHNKNAKIEQVEGKNLLYRMFTQSSASTQGENMDYLKNGKMQFESKAGVKIASNKISDMGNCPTDHQNIVDKSNLEIRTFLNNKIEDDSSNTNPRLVDNNNNNHDYHKDICNESRRVSDRLAERRQHGSHKNTIDTNADNPSRSYSNPRCRPVAYGYSDTSEVNTAGNNRHLRAVSGRITFDQTQNRFMAQWKTSDGSKHSKSFYIKNYNCIADAKRHATEFKQHLLTDQPNIENYRDTSDPQQEQNFISGLLIDLASNAYQNNNLRQQDFLSDYYMLMKSPSHDSFSKHSVATNDDDKNYCQDPNLNRLIKKQKCHDTEECSPNFKSDLKTIGLYADTVI